MSYNVLIVDDSASMRRIIAKALRLSGVEVGEVHEAGNGYEALEIIDAQWLDIVLADLNMPEMGGIELIERLRHRGMTGRVPVVVVSTEGRRDIIDGLLELGAAAFLRKPFAPEELGAVIESVLAPRIAAPDNEALTTSFFEALEGFAMLVGDTTDETPQPPEVACLSRVGFVGPGASGEVHVAAAPSACAAIARSATGEDAGDGADALAELANVTAGQLVDRLVGGPFGLYPPENVSERGIDVWARVLGAGQYAAFDVEGHQVLVSVDVKKRW